MAVKVQATQVTSADGVNSVRTFFEHAGCRFQEVELRNDIGKDAYVDIAHAGVVTPLCIAVQIKSGESYRTRSGDYFIPIGNHSADWRYSSVPVFGVVYDPADQRLRWADITGYLRANVAQEGGSIPIQRDALLDESSLNRDFYAAVQRYAGIDRENLATNLLSDEDSIQRVSVWDAWGLGRHDSRYLILLRRLILHLRGFAIRDAIFLLSHAGDHPDIFWTPLNWIPPDIEVQVRRTFRWSAEEIAHMFRALDIEEWGRGTLGQSLDVLFYAEPKVTEKLRGSVGFLIDDGDVDRAVRAATLVLSHSSDALRDLAWLIGNYPALSEHEWFQDLVALVRAHGTFSLYV
jgi:hypothetical protein